MLPIFESILPIFLLIVLGNLLSHVPMFGRPVWEGMERVSYWVLYPTLLFSTIMHADMSSLKLDAMLLALFLSLFIMGALVLALWLFFRATKTATRGEFSSIFQTAMRWNSFIALAVAQKLYPPEGVAVVALVMAAIIIPLNIASVSVVIRFGTGDASWRRIIFSTVTNPMILGVLAGILFRFVPGGLYAPLSEAAEIVGASAIGVGLLAIGTGLQPATLLRPRIAMLVPLVIKLAAFPALLVFIAYGLGVTGPALLYLALCGSVPTAMNGYVLARQLGGDAEFYAATATLQTAVAFLTMPIVLALAAQFASG